MKRTISIMILVSLLTSLISCASGTDTKETGGQSSGESEVNTPEVVETVETDRSEIKDNLPDVSYNGYTFNIIGRDDNFVYKYELGANEVVGEFVNDAAYERNLAVEERFDIVIEENYSKTISDDIRQAVQSQDASYDLVFNASHWISALALENMFLDWYDIDNVDFSQPWWSANAVSELSVNNHSFFAVGDAAISNIGIAMCIFYNTTLAEHYQLDDIFEVVLDGKWTYDYLNSVIENVATDTNGDGVMDSADTYGFGNNIGSTLQPFVFSLGGRFTEKDENDIPCLSMNNENFVNIVDKVYTLHMENKGTYADVDWQKPRTMFANSQLIFGTGAVYHSATLYRDMDDVVGILPFPKADESMEKYYTCHDPNVSLMAIPNLAGDIKRTGIITEALAIESYKKLTPAFFETALKYKYSQTSESVQILEMIKDGTIFDFAILYGTTSESPAMKLSQCLQELLKKDSKDFASYYATYASAGEEYLTEVINKYLAQE